MALLKLVFLEGQRANSFFLRGTTLQQKNQRPATCSNKYWSKKAWVRGQCLPACTDSFPQLVDMYVCYILQSNNDRSQQWWPKKGRQNVLLASPPRLLSMQLLHGKHKCTMAITLVYSESLWTFPECCEGCITQSSISPTRSVAGFVHALYLFRFNTPGSQCSFLVGQTHPSDQNDALGLALISCISYYHMGTSSKLF